MFQISTSPTPRKATSALAVLAAIGAAGVASQAIAAPVTTTYDPTLAARVANGVNYGNFSNQWNNWLDDLNWRSFGGVSRGYLDWGVNLAATDPVTAAVIKFEKINESTAYGIPDGSHIEVALITQDWSGYAAGPYSWGATGPSVTSQTVLPIDPDNAIFEVDVTSLLQTWQASPSSYYGIRFYITDTAGGIADPNSDNYPAHVSADLFLTTEPIPEPGALGLLAMGGLLGLRRRRR